MLIDNALPTKSRVKPIALLFSIFCNQNDVLPVVKDKIADIMPGFAKAKNSYEKGEHTHRLTNLLTMISCLYDNGMVGDAEFVSLEQ
jgi:hypothetical protein